MTNVAALPALALIVGAAAGVYAPMPIAVFVACAVVGWLTLSIALILPAALITRKPTVAARLTLTASIAGFFGAGAALAADATREALNPPILAHSHTTRADVVGAGEAVPVVVTGIIRSDASATDFGATFTLGADTIRVDGVDRETSGVIRIAVGGTSAARHIDDWRAGRRVRVTTTLAAPLPYLNIGTPNQETRLALAGIRLFGSVKGAAQVELLARGRWWDEAAASARAGLRTAIGRHVSRRNLQSAAIVTAILIGDRAGLDQAVEERLQRAGTFHVIAISGGNIAILTALILGLLRLVGLSPRNSAWITLFVVGLYAFIVGSGISVARAALAAIVYLFARAIDHRTSPLNVLAVVVAAMLVWAPLEILDAGFWLTCLATLAIMLLAQRMTESARGTIVRIAGDAWRNGCGDDWRGMRLGMRIADPAIALLAATLAAEAVLLPVTAYAFSQVSIAGLFLNFLAIPLMTVVQIAGIAVVFCSRWIPPVADAAAAVVALSADTIVRSASIVDAAPWSAPRVAPPPLWLVLACHGCLCAAWFSRPRTWYRRATTSAWVACLILVACALPLPSFTLHAVGSDTCQMTDPDPDSERDRDRDRDRGSRAPPRRLRVTFLDVAQGDATLIRFPDGRVWLVDAGGALGRFDVGTRIVSPALWALGLRRLSTLVLTHGDRDHIGGAHAVLRDFRPDEVWEGVPVDGHAEMTRLRDEAIRRRARWRIAQSNERNDVSWRNVREGGLTERDVGARTHSHDRRGDDRHDDVDVAIRVWHPSAPNLMRTRVHNDDSIVLELAFGNVSVILPGDIGPAVERVLAAQHGDWAAPPSRSRASASMPTVRLAAHAQPTPHERVTLSAPLRVLKAPHHGSKTSSTAAFLDALQPRVAIVSAGRGNRHNHPAPAALARYAARYMEVFRTDRDGAIQLDTDGYTLNVRTCSGRRLTLGAAQDARSSD